MPTQTGQNLLRQLTDGSTDGTNLGNAAADPIGFYGATPIVQPSGNAQSAVSRGQQAGVVATYATTQSPVSAGVATITTSEFVATVQTGTGGTMLIATGDLLFFNPASSQAGLGYGNIRVSASNTVGINFNNITSATITPTASALYTVVAIRGLGKLTSSLVPAAVPASTTMEQQFTIPGIQVGSLVQVSKPTSQTGLDIGGCRAVSNNVIGITFVNVTSAAITPTSAETYTVTSLNGLDAVNNEIMYGFNVGSPGSETTGLVVSGGSTALNGLATTDSIYGIYKPTAQAAASAGIPFAVISAANTLALYYLSQATWTPTSGEVYGIKTARINPVAPLLLYSQQLAPVAVSATTTAEQTFTVSGLVASSAVWVNKPSFQPGLAICGVRVSAVNTLAITYLNTTSASITPTTEVYTIGNFQVPEPGAGNVVYQTAAPIVNSLGNLANASRSAMTSLGLIAGA
jgi:hypothetical protein